MYTVYKIEKDSKILYIGKTNNFKRRKWEHTYKRKLDKSYNFTIIAEKLTKEEAKQKEEEFILKYDTVKMDGIRLMERVQREFRIKKMMEDSKLEIPFIHLGKRKRFYIFKQVLNMVLQESVQKH